MTNRDILSNAIDKAIANGYDYNDLEISIDPLKESDDYLMFLQSYQIIFSHDFAKAFFGSGFYSTEKEKNKNLCCDDPYCNAWWEGKAWQYHLQQMVLKKEPIKYLEKFL